MDDKGAYLVPHPCRDSEYEKEQDDRDESEDACHDRVGAERGFEIVERRSKLRPGRGCVEGWYVISWPKVWFGMDVAQSAGLPC